MAEAESGKQPEVRMERVVDKKLSEMEARWITGLRGVMDHYLLCHKEDQLLVSGRSCDVTGRC